MGLAHLQYERVRRIAAGLLKADRALADVRREAWADLPEDEPLRDPDLAAAVKEAQAAIHDVYVKADMALERLRDNALKER